MNTSNETKAQTDLNSVLAKIAEIAKKAAEGDYIYRGESKTHEKVCSSLYRIGPSMEGIHFDVDEFQKSILEEAKAYIGKTDNIDETDDIGILTELQHFEGRTNLIDFTENYLIALYFACDGSPDEAGRVILLKRELDDYQIRRPRRTTPRVESQRSVFVESPTGFVEPDIVVPIPAELKQPLLDYLRKTLGISVETLYNDLHGFIRRSAHAEYLKGLASQRKSEDAKTFKKKQKHRENAIKHYTEALKLNPDFAEASYNRGFAYVDKGDFDAAIQDYSKVIASNPALTETYNNRGIAYDEKGDFAAAIEDFRKAIDLNAEDTAAYYNRAQALLHQQEWEKAQADFTTAKESGFDIVAAFHTAYETVADFEAQRGVKVPEDIRRLIAPHPKPSGNKNLIVTVFDKIFGIKRESKTFHSENNVVKTFLEVIDHIDIERVKRLNLLN